MKRFFGLLVSASIALGTVPAYAAVTDDTHSVMEINEDDFDRETAERLYIDRLFGIDTAMPYANHGSELLTGAAKEVYEQIKAYGKEIADGKLTKTDDLEIQCSDIITTDDVHRALNHVFSDAPELFYWRGLGYSWYPLGKRILLSLYVSNEFSAAGNMYEVDVSIMNRARKAVDNAKKIAAKYNGLPDYEKIYGYANEICELTDYGGGGLNAHELVDVFDGDASTMVVCEGYARAFQYLCDLGGIDCYNVTGSDHRWNIVVLDGKSYHVDCTWADGFPIDKVISYHPYILRGVAESDGKGVKFNFTVPGYMPSTGSLTYDEETLSLYPQSILKVSTVDYEPPRADMIKVNIKTPSRRIEA